MSCRLGGTRHLLVGDLLHQSSSHDNSIPPLELRLHGYVKQRYAPREAIELLQREWMLGGRTKADHMMKKNQVMTVRKKRSLQRTKAELQSENEYAGAIGQD